MASEEHEKLVGGDAIAIESVITGLLVIFIGSLQTELVYYLIYFGALVGVILLLLLRGMAAMADEPNISVIRGTLRWSSVLMDIAFIGALASLCIHAIRYTSGFSPIILFTSGAFALALSVALIDTVILGEYVDTWVTQIYEETSDTLVGELLRDIGDFGRSQADAFREGESASAPIAPFKALLLGIALLIVVLLVSLPVGVVLLDWFGRSSVAILVVLSLFFLRDLARYIFIGYGAAISLSELRFPLKWEFTLMAFKGILLARTFGYEIPTSL